MNLWTSMRIGLSFLVMLTFAIGSVQLKSQTAPTQRHGTAEPSITVTNVPPSGAGGPDKTAPIGGTAAGVDFSKHKVVIYAFAGGTWWVQPTTASPLTKVDARGNWQTITHLGSTYAAMLVKQSYRPTATTDEVPQVGEEVLAVKLVAGK
jgi:hypothetical protein